MCTINIPMNTIRNHRKKQEHANLQQCNSASAVVTMVMGEFDIALVQEPGFKISC